MDANQSDKLFQMIEEIEQTHSTDSLSHYERDRMEKNRLRALAVKQSRIKNKRNANNSFISESKVVCLRSLSSFIIKFRTYSKYFLFNILLLVELNGN